MAHLFSVEENSLLHRIVQDAWEDVGTHVLYYTGFGLYGFGNNVRPIKSPDDFRGLKLRVSGSTHAVDCLQAMGEGLTPPMTVVTIPWADLYGALQTGVVDGCWDIWPSLVDERHYEVLKYYTDVNWVIDNQEALINKALWDGLPADLKDAINRAARVAEKYHIQICQDKIDKTIEYLKTESDLEIYFLTPEERDLFRTKANPVKLWEKSYKDVLEQHYPGQNMVQQIADEVERVRAAARATGKL